MPDHVRKQIRDYVAAGLGALATTGDRVFVGRTRPLAKGHQPTLLIYTRSETSRRAVSGRPPLLERDCTLHIEGRVVAAAPPDDLLDTIAAEIEAGMAAMVDYQTAKFFGGLALNVRLSATEAVAEAEGENHIGGIRLEYLVTYRTAEGAPTATA
ncbi:hypothetical protein [Bradyrhizobium sp. Bra78]|uniref:hypothetical protein n=1 Tax=Bradyrhizobium sp. Bra78 TaxID=2926010 RepID=UPI0021C7ECE6|nr:hypothetical protein [Bradyrhizobium sp. Bra78]